MTPVRAWAEWPAHWRDARGAALVSGLLLALLTLAAILRLAPEWMRNPDLSHGFFTPVLFVLLFNESRQRGPWRWLPPNAATVTAITILLASALALLAGASLFAAALSWQHPVVLSLLGLGFVAGLGAAWLHAATAPVRLVPFNAIAAIALLLWLMSLPVPPGTYSRLTVGMQLWVTERVLGALHLLGIPAIQNGNVIELARTTVGVEEACSGVRSLISCTYAGFFFAAAFVQRWPSRLLLIGLAPLLAIGMNFIRSLGLTLLAHRGVDIAGFWHDATGFAILALTALLLGALAWTLAKFEPAARLAPPPPSAAWSGARRGERLLAVAGTAAVLWLLALIVLTRPAEFRDDDATSPPDILALLPAAPPGWQVATSNDLYRFAGILETDNLGERIYLKDGADGQPVQITVYLAYWPAGRTGVSTVASHTPDACWPGAGWEPRETDTRQVRLELGDRHLNRAEYRLFHNRRIPQHVWFWHSYDRRVIADFNPRRPLELLSSVFHYGVRSDGEQLFVRLSSNRPWAACSRAARRRIPGKPSPTNRSLLKFFNASSPTDSDRFAMLFKLTARERIALIALGLLIVLGVIGLAVL